MKYILNIIFTLFIATGLLSCAGNGGKPIADNSAIAESSKTNSNATLSLLPLVNDRYVLDQRIHFGRNYYNPYGTDSIWGLSSFTPIFIDGEWLYEGYEENDGGWYRYYNKKGELVKKHAYSHSDDANIYWTDNKRNNLHQGKNIHDRYISLCSYTPGRDMIYSYLFYDDVASDTLICINFDDFHWSHYQYLGGFRSPPDDKSDSLFITSLISSKLPKFPISEIEKPEYRNMTEKELDEDIEYRKKLIAYDNAVSKLYKTYIAQLVQDSKEPIYLFSQNAQNKEQLMGYNASTFYLILHNSKLAIEMNPRNKRWGEIIADLPMYIPPIEKVISPIAENISLTKVDREIIGWEGGSGRLNPGKPTLLHTYQLICNKDTFVLENQNELSIHNTYVRDDNSSVITLYIVNAGSNCIILEYTPHKE